MAWSNFYGGAIGNVLAKWEEMGVFSYVLPFLIIFSLIFIILNQIKLFKENRAVNSVIALAVGFMSLQFEFVPRFFAEIFPRVGIGLAIILVILIFLGMFIDPEKPGIMIGLMIVGAVIVVVVLINTAGSVGWTAGYWWEDNWGTVIGIVAFLAIIFLVIGTSNKDPNQPKQNLIYKALGFR